MFLGKTFTMIGDSSGNFPGIAPRAFDEIFDLLESNKKKFSYDVSVSSFLMDSKNINVTSKFIVVTFDTFVSLHCISIS